MLLVVFNMSCVSPPVLMCVCCAEVGSRAESTEQQSSGRVTPVARPEETNEPPPEVRVQQKCTLSKQYTWSPH